MSFHINALYLPKGLSKQEIYNHVKDDLSFLYDQDNNPLADLESFTCLHPRKVNKFINDTHHRLQKSDRGILVHLFEDHQTDKICREMKEEMERILNSPTTQVISFADDKKSNFFAKIIERLKNIVKRDK